jgi:hypothetical protein
MGLEESKTKVCLVLTHRQQLRSWVYNGIYAQLADNFEMEFFLPQDFEDLRTDKEFKSEKIGFWSVSPNPKFERIGLFLQLVKHRKHKTFRERIRKQILDEKVFKGKISLVLYIIRSLRRKTILFGMHLHPIHSYYNSRYIRNLKKNHLSNLPEAHIYLVVTSLSDYSTDVMLQSLKTSGKDFVQVVENWDNLSSKLSLQFNPMKLVVWGEQTKNQAVKIHKFNSDAIEILGSPRFPPLGKVKKFEDLELGSKKSVSIYYAGFYSVCNDLTSIIEIQNELAKNLVDHDIKFIYRPHPMNKESILAEYRELQPRNISLDVLSGEEINKSNWPTYFDGFYKEMLKCDLVIGSPSTFLLEQIMLDMPIILDYRECSEHYNSARRYFVHSTHLEEIVNTALIPKMYVASDISELVLKALLENSPSLDLLKDYLIYNDEDEYSARLVKVLSTLNFG